tara:strand:- start:48 stop:413 length:366 start_codon:yes stop_codon:yes gene_type:complete
MVLKTKPKSKIGNSCKKSADCLNNNCVSKVCTRKNVKIVSKKKKTKNKTLKNENSLETFIKLAKKYQVIQSGSRKQIAERLSSLRGSYLSKTDKKIILPYLSNNVNKRILLQDFTPQKLPK